jgi:hypothetical protein
MTQRSIVVTEKKLLVSPDPPLDSETMSCEQVTAACVDWLASHDGMARLHARSRVYFVMSVVTDEQTNEMIGLRFDAYPERGES